MLSGVQSRGGRPDPARGVSQPGFQALLAMAGNGMMLSAAIHLGLRSGPTYVWAENLTFVASVIATNVVTADPTLTANAFLYQAALNQRATFRWVAQPYGEILIPATASNGIMIGLSAASTSVMNVGVQFEEC